MLPSVSVPGVQVKDVGRVKAYEILPSWNTLTGSSAGSERSRMLSNDPMNVRQSVQSGYSVPSPAPSEFGRYSLQDGGHSPCCSGCSESGSACASARRDSHGWKLDPGVSIPKVEVYDALHRQNVPYVSSPLQPQQALCARVGAEVQRYVAYARAMFTRVQRARAAVQACMDTNNLQNLPCTALIRAQAQNITDQGEAAAVCLAEMMRAVYNGPGCTRQRALQSEWMALEIEIRDCQSTIGDITHALYIDRECALRRMELEHAIEDYTNALNLIRERAQYYDLESRRLGGRFHWILRCGGVESARTYADAALLLGPFESP